MAFHLSSMHKPLSSQHWSSCWLHRMQELCLLYRNTDPHQLRTWPYLQKVLNWPSHCLKDGLNWSRLVNAGRFQKTYILSEHQMTNEVIKWKLNWLPASKEASVIFHGLNLQPTEKLIWKKWEDKAGKANITKTIFGLTFHPSSHFHCYNKHNLTLHKQPLELLYKHRQDENCVTSNANLCFVSY